MHVEAPEAVRDGIAIATFTFDNTMTLPGYDKKQKVWFRTQEPNPIVLEEMFRLACMGWKVYILTDRPETLGDKATIRGFIKKHKLPVDGIVFTYGEPKTDFINALQSFVHYDDNLSELHNLPVGTTGIRVPHPEDITPDLAAVTRVMLGGWT